MGNTNGMTELLIEYVTSGNMTLEDAKAKLYDNAYIRTSAETLARFCEIDPKDTDLLRAKLVELLHISKPSANIESLQTTVRRWINENRNVKKDSALQLAFASKLKIKDAEDLLRRLCGEGFHWRDPKDIIWLFALDHGMSYQEACNLSDQMAPIYTLPKNAPDNPNAMTVMIQSEVIKIQTIEELEEFFKEYAPCLGTLHNTAYELFLEFLRILINPDLSKADLDNLLEEEDKPDPDQGKKSHEEDYMPGERNMSIEEILSTYLYNNIVPRVQKSNENNHQIDNRIKDAIQRNIQQNWPDKYTLSRMYHRKTDVTRKTLILLFLACDGGESNYGSVYNGYAYDIPENIFEDTFGRLHQMLNICGFAPLDPRIPFDWMVLYSMVVDEKICIDESISEFLTELFRDSADDETV